MMVGNHEMDMTTTQLPQRYGKSTPYGISLLMFVILWVATSVLVYKTFPSLLGQYIVLAGFLTGLAAAIFTFRGVSKAVRWQKAREAQEMQQSRAAEFEKQHAEMKHKAAEAKGIN